MNELLQFFIDQASIDPNHLTGMIVAGIIVLGILLFFTSYIFNLVIEFVSVFIRRFKPIQITKVNKVDKIVEVPNPEQYDAIIKKLNQLETKIDKGGINL